MSVRALVHALFGVVEAYGAHDDAAEAFFEVGAAAG